MKVETIEQLTKRNAPKAPNRVAGGFSPPAPTTPCSRVKSFCMIRDYIRVLKSIFEKFVAPRNVVTFCDKNIYNLTIFLEIT